MKKHPILFSLLTIIGLILIFSIFSRFFGEESSFMPGEKIAVIEIKGVIIDSRPIINEILKFKKNDSVKAVVLRINSPGGAVGPSQEIFKEVMKLNKEKKVVASLGSIATSGGYYIACAAEKILANPGTITGSIGVMMKFTNFEQLFSKIGLKGVMIKSGEYKDIGSPFREMTPKDKKILKGVIRDIHRQFIEVVAEGRKIPLKKVREKLADGRIFTGNQAKGLGLVDELGNLQDTIRIAAKMADIQGEPRVIYPKERSSLLGILLNKSLMALRSGLYDIDNNNISYLYVP